MGPAERAGFDAHMMQIALSLAARGLGRTAPNPAVGAVIADERTGEIIARGWTAPGGRPHAETEAIARAGARARGATMYVTLEPCSHHGVTPPCADAILNAGLARVVCAIEDPDPRVAGRGLARLRQSGIEVERGLLLEPAHWVAAGHILRVTERRPLMTAKLALDAAGEVPRGRRGQPTWGTSEASRALGHLMRARSDAILVGRRTVLDDDPLLTCRLPGLAARSPVRIVLARDPEGLELSRLVQTASQHPLWVVCGEGIDVAALAAKGVEVVSAPLVGGELWLPAVMERLVARGITRLLLEGGPTTWTAFSRASLIDEIVLFHARGSDGAELSPPAALKAIGRYVSTSGFDIYDRRTVGGDDMLALRRHWHRGNRGQTEGK
ncbi:bifunctional diaminohydroxyphosphoribosylaminopyrimidine deaminase/5-amino-6-(5-phosphoribosylamino)uracil reductase RibD [Hyphomicrobium sp.]|uniref:bifunctional diaminohydroxyphosphoribosylaminopyrimidine deaminase/5-amino-6-(5-phosphoribosylamino)uracil reductase RibD n=1 Tax=Hyphomicrobium sp. TaxID=82 RepID=UPI00132C3E29|nr:bifunctional diaminohydroxyphosphoribosylaminopyrimidine deaminase/5-amino-6-(5-phosphoribosylamino)uracil reductase RibD [Hyphomicrobium sp.]KAB2941225.1 MAG: bifunctional diaminohydroxyphosphoribosylaminopyrimidine deaminase/5-amino-6-(5-phosphoribosylamino)uracil reductase RibD [Hyphomicrobium sp.]